MDTIYKWKPVKGENHGFVIVVMQRQTPTTLLHLIFRRLQPIGGCYLNFSASYNMQGSSNSHMFSAGYNSQEAPTSTNSNQIFMKPQLERLLQTPDANKKQPCVGLFGHKFCIFPSSFLPLLPFKSALHQLHICWGTNA